MKNDKSTPEYLVVFGGARDHYQVAVALQEAGKLRLLVNEFYLPALPGWLRAVVSAVDRKGRSRVRSHPGLPPDRVKHAWVALVVNLLLRIRRNLRLVEWRDAALGIKCGRLAARLGGPVLAYSYYASYVFDRAKPGQRKVIFQVHPHPTAVRGILLEELKRLPMAESLSKEFELGFPKATLDRLCREALQADFVITPSSFAKQTLVEAGVVPERIAVVPYGIDPGVFLPKTFEPAPQRPLRLIFVGSLIQRKGLSYLLEAVRRLDRGQVELILAGRGARDETLLAQFADVPFRLVWNASRDELVRELQAADVFVFPSLVESFAHVILEAMAVGLPVITTTNTAGPDLLEDGRTGFVGGIRDVDFLVDKIRWFLAHRDAIPVMGRACQAEAQRRTWPRFRTEILVALEKFEQR
jgi:glycosyltransferase involved in cell wall biosynthesis